MKRNLVILLAVLCTAFSLLVLFAGCPVTEEPPENANLAPPTKSIDEAPAVDENNKEAEANAAEEEKYEATPESDEASKTETSNPTDETKPEEKSDANSENKPAIDKTKVRFETQLGNIDILVHPEWDLYGAKRFLDLVKDGFYTNAPWFRIVPGFVIQCGVSGKPELQAKWGMNTFEDSPVLKGNEPWTLSFGKSGAPNSRSTHIFINVGNNIPSLDPQGFSAFAEVLAGKDVVEKIINKSGAQPGDDFSVDQGKMQAEGIEFIKKDPMYKDKIVWIKKTTIIK